LARSAVKEEAKTTIQRYGEQFVRKWFLSPPEWRESLYHTDGI